MIIGIERLNTNKSKSPTMSNEKIAVREDLEGFEKDVKQETKNAILIRLLDAASKSEDKDTILKFLRQDPTIDCLLGDDPSEYSQRIGTIVSTEGLAADMKERLKRVPKLAALLTPVWSVLAATGGGTLAGLLLAIPVIFITCLLGLYTVLGIYAVLHLVLVRIGRYYKNLRQVKQKGLNSELFNNGKKYFSDYLPRYNEWRNYTGRISTLQRLCTEIILHPESANATDLAKKFRSAGMIVEDGNVKAGSHLDKYDQDMSIVDKGWNADSLMKAVDEVLVIVETLVKTTNSKDQVMKLKVLGKPERKLLKGAYKELHFWILDLARGVSDAAKRYTNR